jgi:uncharacterized protein
MRFMTTDDGASITGATGEWEIWTDDQDGAESLGETCATAYQLRVYESLLRLKGNARYGDLIERTIYNTLFAAQSADGRQIRYYTPHEGSREYLDKDNYCCSGNFRRIVAELPTMVYYRSGSGLAVALYTPSEATVDLDDGCAVQVRQETDYPNSGHVVLRLDPSKAVQFPLKLRIPRWCQNATVAINGEPSNATIKCGEFVSIEREWKPGDTVTIDLPMTWRFVQGRKRQAGRAAVMRGPIVFCLNPAQNKTLAKWSGSELGRIMLYPATIKTAPMNNAVRPGGMACSITAGTPGYDMWSSGNLSLRLTEFPDPDGKVVYFRLPDPGVAVPDELFGGR